MPTAAIVVTNDEPPKLTKGRGTPVKGMRATTEPILRIAWTAIQQAMPVASNAPYISGARRPTRNAP